MITKVAIVLFYCIFSCNSKKVTIVKREDFLQYDAPNFGNNMEFPNQFEAARVKTHFEPKTNIPIEPNQELINEDDQSNEIPIGPLETLEGSKAEGNVRLKDLLTFIRKTNIPENPYETVPQQTQDQNKYNTDLDNNQPQNLLEMLAKKNFITQEKQWPASGTFQNIPTYFQNGIAPVKKEEIPHTKERKEIKEVAANKKDAMEETEDSEMKYNYEAIYGRSKNAPYFGAQMVKKSSVPKIKNEEEFRPSRKDKSNEESDSINLVTRETKATDNPVNSSLSNYGQLVISEIMAPLNLSSENTTTQIVNSTIKNTFIPEQSTEKLNLINNTNILSNTSTNTSLNIISPLNIATLNVISPLNNAFINATTNEQDTLTTHIQELQKQSTYVAENTPITIKTANANTGYENILQYDNKIPLQSNNKKITSDNQINKISKIEILSDPYENFRRTVTKPSNQIINFNGQAITASSQVTTSNQESTQTYQSGHSIQNNPYQILSNRGFVMKHGEKPIENNQDIHSNYLTHQTLNSQYKKADIPGLTIQHLQEKARKDNIPYENSYQQMATDASNEKKSNIYNYKDYNSDRIKKTIIKNIDPNEHLRDISAWKLIEELNKMKKSTIPQMLNFNRDASQQFKKTEIKRAPYSDSYPLVLNKYPLEGHFYKKVSNDIFKKSGIPLPVAHVDSFPLVLRMRPAEGSLTREHITAKQNTFNRKQLITENQNAPATNTFVSENRNSPVSNTFFTQKLNNNHGGSSFIPNYLSLRTKQNGIVQETRYGNNFYFKQKKSEILNKDDNEKNNLKNNNAKRSRIQYPEQLESNNPTQNLYQTKNDGSSGQMFTQPNEIVQSDDNNKFQTSYSNQESNTPTNNDQEYNLLKSQIMNNAIDHLTSTPIGDDGFQNQFQQLSQNSDENRKNIETDMVPNNPQGDNDQNLQEENSLSENQREAARDMLQKRGQIPKPPSYFHPQSGKIESYPLLLRRYPAEGSMNLRGRSIIPTFNNTEENPIDNNNYRD